jgi:hypothetical protein
MKRYLLLAICFFISPVFAQVTSNSTTDVQSGASAGASNNGVTLDSQNVFEAGDHMRYSGTQRFEQVAPLSLGGASAGFSNENCANTTQGGLSTFWFSAAKGNATESIRCNARRDAGVYVALADVEDAKGHRDIGEKLRSMARYQKCTATQQEIEACQMLGLIGKDGGPIVETDSYRAVIPTRPVGWSNEPQIDKTRTPAARDSGWIEPR